jgi:hypothetical protein
LRASLGDRGGSAPPRRRLGGAGCTFFSRSAVSSRRCCSAGAALLLGLARCFWLFLDAPAVLGLHALGVRRSVSSFSALDAAPPRSSRFCVDLFLLGRALLLEHARASRRCA